MLSNTELVGHGLVGDGSCQTELVDVECQTELDASNMDEIMELMELMKLMGQMQLQEGASESASEVVPEAGAVVDVATSSAKEEMGQEEMDQEETGQDVPEVGETVEVASSSVMLSDAAEDMEVEF